MGREAQKRRRKQRRHQAAEAGGSAGTPAGQPGQELAQEPAVKGGAVAKTASAATGRSGRAGDPDGPPAPLWGTFPLSEIVTFIGLLLFAAGLFIAPPRGAVMNGVGLGLASLAGLEVAGREHFSGYRSHTLLLAGAPAVAAMAILFLVGPDSLDPPYKLGIGAGIFALSGLAAALAFRRSSGGSLVRFRGRRKR